MCKKFNLLLLWAIVVLTLQTAALAADPNMIAIYWMDAGEGTTVWDYTGNGRNGTINGDVSWSGAGMIGGCLEFSGGTVDITNNVDNLSFGDVDLTVTAWIKTTAVNTAFFSKDTADGEGNNFAFGVGNYDEPNWATAVVTNRNRANIRSVSDVNTGDWVHLAFVQDYDEAGGGELWSMYVNGVLETRQLTDILRDNGREGMYIGRGEQ